MTKTPTKTNQDSPAAAQFEDIGNGHESDNENDTGIDLAITTDRNTRAGSD